MITVGPLWFLNLTLMMLNFILIIFLGVSYNEIKINFLLNNKNNEKIELIKSEIPNLAEITERDVFNTVDPIKKQKKIYIYQPNTIVNMIYPPAYPTPLQIQPQVVFEREMLPPLQITLHGTIINDNPVKNKVFIENMRTKEEKDYSIGDIVEDAQIVFISKNKVIFVRSNGQEESIYLNKLFKIEEEANSNISWNKIITTNDNIKNIDLNLFGYKIKSFGAFIEELGLATYFENGIPVGCKIKNTKSNSLAQVLGFIENDIIISINNLPINTTEARATCINSIIKNFINEEFIINVAFKRNNEIYNTLFKCYKNNKKNVAKNNGLFKINEHKKSENI